MADQAYSLSGALLAISTTTAPDDLTDHATAGFPGLAYTAVGNVGSIGPYGITTNAISYNTLDRLVSLKAKGISNAGDPEIECARTDADAGQLLMQAAGLPSNRNTYAFRVTKQDGSIDYLRGLVAGPVSSNGRVEDFDLHTFTLMLVQVPVHIDAP